MHLNKASYRRSDDQTLILISGGARGWPSASKIEAGILSKFEPNLDHLGEMRKGIQIKTIRNLNLDHLGGNAKS